MQFALLCFCTVTLIVPTEQQSRIDLYLMWHAYYWILSLSIICSWCNVLTNIPPAGWLRGTGVYITMNIIIQCNCPQSPSNNCLLSSTSHQLLLFVMEGEGETDHMLLIFYWDSLYEPNLLMMVLLGWLNLWPPVLASGLFIEFEYCLPKQLFEMLLQYLNFQ